MKYLVVTEEAKLLSIVMSLYNWTVQELQVVPRIQDLSVSQICFRIERIPFVLQQERQLGLGDTAEKL